MSKRQRKKKKSSGKVYIAGIMLFLVFVMSIQLVRLYQKNQQYAVQEKALATELQEQQDKQSELQNYETYTKSQEYVEDTAKSKLGLLYNDEIIFREK